MNRNLSVDEACGVARISRAMLYKLWRQGEGPGVTKIGKRTFVSTDTLEKWLKSLETKSLNGWVVPCNPSAV